MNTLLSSPAPFATMRLVHARAGTVAAIAAVSIAVSLFIDGLFLGEFSEHSEDSESSENSDKPDRSDRSDESDRSAIMNCEL